MLIIEHFYLVYLALASVKYSIYTLAMYTQYGKEKRGPNHVKTKNCKCS